MRYVVCLVMFCVPAFAHFQLLIPSQDILNDETGADVTLDLQFTHPATDGPVMEMGPPTACSVLINGKSTDLLPKLEHQSVDGKSTYTLSYSVNEPGDHVFSVSPAPYWEPAESKYIIHYTKVVVDGFGGGEGWDALVGLPVEIQPLVRPYGLWTGNLFRGVALHNGKPVPHAEIEVAYYNKGGHVGIPNETFEIQIIKADANGVFSYAMPRAGWWGFAVLVDGDEKQPSPEGDEADVELGGLMWVQVCDMKEGH